MSLGSGGVLVLRITEVNEHITATPVSEGSTTTLQPVWSGLEGLDSSDEDLLLCLHHLDPETGNL